MKIIAYPLIALSLLLIGCQSTGNDGKPLTPAEIVQKRDANIKMAQTGLAAFLKQDPTAKKLISESAGYAVFNTTNVNIVLLVVASCVHWRKTGLGPQTAVEIVARLSGFSQYCTFRLWASLLGVALSSGLLVLIAKGPGLSSL